MTDNVEQTLKNFGVSIGQESTFVDEYEIEKGMIKRFAQTIEDPNPLFHDEEYAKNTSYGGIIAPPTFLFEWNHHSAFPTETSFSPGERDTTPVFDHNEAPIYWGRAQNEYELFEPLRPGDIIHCRSRVIDAYEKQTKAGSMVFLVGETIYTNQKGVLLGIHRETMFATPKAV